jgi:acyl dehydratase
VKRVEKKFVELSIGDDLPPFTISETQESIDDAVIHVEGVDFNPRNIHNDPDFAKSGMFSGTVNGGPTTMAYVCQMLEQWFPAKCFYKSGSLSFKAIRPIRPGDTVKFTGKVTGKRSEGAARFVDCCIEGKNQNQVVVGVAEATVCLSG